MGAHIVSHPKVYCSVSTGYNAVLKKYALKQSAVRKKQVSSIAEQCKYKKKGKNVVIRFTSSKIFKFLRQRAYNI